MPRHIQTAISEGVTMCFAQVQGKTDLYGFHMN